jgi:HD-GYP domain-containing protein (c-di-GMP phosphodiesterase class II)
VAKQTTKIRQSYLNAITSLANALDAKDKYTHGHSKRVTETAVAIAREMDMSRDTIDRIELAGLLHDIGKIGISEEILNKPRKAHGCGIPGGKITPRDWRAYPGTFYRR